MCGFLLDFRPFSQLRYGFYECNYYEQNSKIPTDVLAEWRHRTPYAAHFGDIRRPLW